MHGIENLDSCINLLAGDGERRCEADRAFAGREDDQPAGERFLRQFAGLFACGIPARQAAGLAATQRPLTASTLTETLDGVPAWKTIPSWDVIGTADKVLPPAEQQIMANRAGAHITKVDAPHLSMISDPDAVTGVIVDAARATS